MRSVFCFALGLALLPPAARAQITVTVDAAADAHPISPLIYGMNFASAAQVAAAHIPLTRWGGNSTTRYNYRIDVTNTGSDYFFENVAGCWNGRDKYCATPPADPLTNSGANAFLDAARKAQLVTLFTIPTMGWVAKAPPKYGHPFDCGCPKTALPNQDKFDPYDTNCGNCQSKGAWLQAPAATTTSMVADPTFTAVWVSYLTTQYGPSMGRRIYALDNEPNLWSSTHHDVHPARLTYSELWQRMRDHSLAILQADKTATVAGPAEWGWPNYFCSDADDISKGCFPNSPDRATHGGEELVAWLLDQAAAYEKANGTRILHYLDLHYYPQGGNVPEVTRSLWDPAYTDPSWINEKIRLIPRMRDWVSQHYPGTRIAISEYDFGHHNDATGAVTYAEVLGIFGREGLDAATAWSPPGETEAAFGAYKLYLNFDGNGAHFEADSARADVSGGATVKAYAATGPTRATVALVNEANMPATIAVSFKSFMPQMTAKWYTASGANVTAQPDVTLNGGQAKVTLPALSIGMLAVDGQNAVMPDMGGPNDMAGMPGLPDLRSVDGGGGPYFDNDADWPVLHDGGTEAKNPSGCSCDMSGRRGANRGAPFCLLFALMGLALVRARRAA